MWQFSSPLDLLLGLRTSSAAVTFLWPFSILQRTDSTLYELWSLGLAFLQCHGITHCNISSSNLFLSASADGQHSTRGFIADVEFVKLPPQGEHDIAGPVMTVNALAQFTAKHLLSLVLPLGNDAVHRNRNPAVHSAEETLQV